MASHVSHCMAKAYACRTHGKPCVIMHGHVKTYKYEIMGGSKCSSWDSSKLSLWEQQGEGGGREERRREREGKGKEKERRREEKERKKEKKKGEEERKKKRKRERKECCAVSRPGRQRTRNCATRGRFPSTLVILRLGAV